MTGGMTLLRTANRHRLVQVSIDTWPIDLSQARQILDRSPLA